MSDTITLSASVAVQATPLKDPKILQINRPPGRPPYGCEHVEKMLKADASKAHRFVSQYAKSLIWIYGQNRTSAQTIPHRTGSGAGSPSTTSITPNHLCLSCPVIGVRGVMVEHGREKGHGFAVNTRSGCLYCQQCKDYIYDRSMEELRNQRDPQTAYAGRKKRKLEELYPVKEDLRMVDTNSVEAPCRAAGLRGLYNMGQTCFMAVILQSLIHNPLLRSHYLGDEHNHKGCERDACLSCAMDEMFSDLFTTDKTEGYAPVNFLARTWQRNANLAGHKQQDAHEYFQFLLDQLHIETRQPDEKLYPDRCPCIIHRTYYGRLQSDVVCQTCKNMTTTSDPMIDLSLDLRSQVEKQQQVRRRLLSNGKSAPALAAEVARLSLHDCLRNFTTSERASYSCSKCKESPKKSSSSEQTATKQLSIRKLPPVLCIQLKVSSLAQSHRFFGRPPTDPAPPVQRFEAGFDASTSTVAAKLDTPVDFPLQLDMSSYTTRAVHAARKGRSGAAVIELARSCAYDLSSVVVHIGKMNGGHYVSYCREGKQWYLFDDHRVSAASEAAVLAAEAYLLVYTARAIT
ncbi:MAG: hypothetical protein M1832_002926 [Thelocarpon impressellum]|nr:MAG: hypothetical protein M1832_002926 [Thelocarpon impressellum]